MTVRPPFEFDYLEEPEIHFRNEESETSPKRGLSKHGPRLRKDEHHAINVGIIGDRTSINRLTSLFEDMRSPIHPEPDGEEDIKPWKVPYPGTGKNSPLNVSIDASKAWQQKIGRAALQAVKTQSSTRGKMEELLDTIEDKVEFLSNIDGPNVIVVCIPEEIMVECTPEDEDEPKIQAGGTDLRNRVKLFGMEHNIPTQLIKPSTLDITDEDERASRAWNLTVGLLYKSQSGYPWKTKSLEPGTCYAGIGFYRVRGQGANIVRAALTHVFTNHGYTILQSKPMRDIEEDDNGQPHLSYEGATHVAEQILSHYKQSKSGALPDRLVIHKPSSFTNDEREGFLDTTTQVATRDLVHIREYTDLRLFTDGDFTVQRGRLLSIPDDDRHYLFTTGYDAGVTTYEGSNIPSPIEIRPDEYSETPSKELCREILFLTKLDWNTPDIAVKMPATIKIARRVGRVLSDSEADPDEAEVKYYYYM